MTFLALDIGNTRLKWAQYDSPHPNAALLHHGAEFLENIDRLADGPWSTMQLPTHVLGCVVHASAVAPQPGRVERIKNNQLIVGEPAGGITPKVQAVAALLEQAGFAVKQAERIQQDIWFKLWGNMTMNPVSALTGAPCDQILDDPLVRAYCSAVMREAQAIGQRIGCGIDQQPDDRHAVTRKLGSFKTSMLQSLEKGSLTEIDYINGAVVQWGQRLGVPTPVNQTLVACIKGIEATLKD